MAKNIQKSAEEKALLDLQNQRSNTIDSIVQIVIQRMGGCIIEGHKFSAIDLEGNIDLLKLNHFIDESEIELVRKCESKI